MRDLAFAAFRVLAVSYFFLATFPIVATQIAMIPSVLVDLEDARKAGWLANAVVYIVSSVLFPAVLFVLARPLSKVVPDRELPQIAFDISLVTRVTFIVAGIGLIAASADGAALFIEDVLQWANIVPGHANGLRHWSREWQNGSELIVGVLFLILANRR
jgi:hypothetical protein